MSGQTEVLGELVNDWIAATLGRDTDPGAGGQAATDAMLFSCGVPCVGEEL